MTATAYYQHLLDLSQGMLKAGNAQDWDQLIELEQQRKAALNLPPPAINQDGTGPSIALIHQIQACDRELLEKLEAWMDHARVLLRLDTKNVSKR